MHLQRLVAAATLGLAALFAGCASNPQRHVDACKEIASSPTANIECIQTRLRTDPSTPEPLQSRIDFMAASSRTLDARITAGEITSDHARSAYETLGRELDRPPVAGTLTVYVSKETLDAIGLPADTLAFSRYVQPVAAARGAYKNLMADSKTEPSGTSAPCVSSTCGPVSVKGYYRKDGTYVRPHTRSSSGAGRGRR
jgi:hypothetical protein